MPKKPFELKTKESDKAGLVYVEVSEIFLEELEKHNESRGRDFWKTPLEQSVSTFYQEQYNNAQTTDDGNIGFAEVNDDGADIGELFNADELEKKTDLNSQQILAFARAKTIADRYNSPTLNTFLYNYANYAISKNRKGRSEFVEAFKIKVLEPLGIGGVDNGKDK